MELKTIPDLHLEHEEWLDSLTFYFDEFEIMQNRLSTLSEKLKSKDALSMLEHLQNELTVQEEQAMILREEIQKLEHMFEQYVNDFPVDAELREMKDHDRLRGRMERAEELFNQFRKELNKFIVSVED